MFGLLIEETHVAKLGHHSPFESRTKSKAITEGSSPELVVASTHPREVLLGLSPCPSPFIQGLSSSTFSHGKLSLHPSKARGELRPSIPPCLKLRPALLRPSSSTFSNKRFSTSLDHELISRKVIGCESLDHEREVN